MTNIFACQIVLDKLIKSLSNTIWYQRRESNSLKAANLAERAYKTPRTPSLAGILNLLE
jgi:hypothetical protein